MSSSFMKPKQEQMILLFRRKKKRERDEHGTLENVWVRRKKVKVQNL